MPTPCLKWHFFVQMRFSFYLFGSFNGSLAVAIEENGTSTAPLIWEGRGQWKDDWEDVVLQLTELHHGYFIHTQDTLFQASVAFHSALNLYSIFVNAKKKMLDRFSSKNCFWLFLMWWIVNSTLSLRNTHDQQHLLRLLFGSGGLSGPAWPSLLA